MGAGKIASTNFNILHFHTFISLELLLAALIVSTLYHYAIYTIHKQPQSQCYMRGNLISPNFHYYIWEYISAHYSLGSLKFALNTFS